METQRRVKAIKALRPWGLPLGVSIAAALLYLRTLAPGTVYLQDVAEFQTKLYTLEIIHATGYPFYQMLGKLWTMLLPLGTIAWRVNLLSAFFSVICLICLCRIMQQIGVRPWAIASACGMLACSRLFWSYSILTSTYTMHLAFVALTVLALLHWQGRHNSPVWLALACGMGLAHHRVFVIVLPALALVILLDVHTRRQPLRQWLKLGALIAVPSLLSYAWLAWLGVWPLNSLFHYLFHEGGKYVHHTPDLTAWAQRLVDTIWPWLIEPFGLLPTLLALVGLLTLVRLKADKMRQRTGMLLLALGAVILVFFSIAWIAPDDRRYFLPLDFALAAGWGLAWDGGWGFLRRRLQQRWLARATQVVMALAALAPTIWLYHANLAAIAPLHDGYADRVSREILSTVESGATIFGTWVLGWPLRYYHTVEHLRPDVRVVVEPGDVYRAEATALASTGAPVYFREQMYGLDWEESGYVWAPLTIGNLARALPAVPPLEHAVEIGQGFEGGVTLRSFGFSTWPLHPDTFVRLRLDWEGTHVLAPETGVHLRLDDAAGMTRWRYDVAWSHLAGDGNSQTDIYWVTPPTLAPGDYTLHVGLYEPNTARSLGEIQTKPIPVTAGPALTNERLVLENQFHPPLQIPPEAPDLHLLGHGFLDREMWSGHMVPLSLFWQVIHVPEAAHTVSFAIERHGEQYKVSPDYPIPIPYPGALVESSCVLQVPSGVADGRYLLTATVDDGREQWNLSLREIRVCDRPHTYRVPKMQYRLAVTLGEGISLLGYDLTPASVKPDQDLTVTLYWQAQASVDAWFKVFAHLIGPDGTLLSQHDGLPAEGAAPTSQWLAGEVIIDRHIIPIPADAPSGECTLYVGMYSPDTGDRLLALDANGNPYPHNAIPLRTVPVTPADEGAP